MTRIVALCAALAVAAPLAATAQGAFPAPRGHRQPTVADVPDAGGTRLGPAQSGRSVGRGSIGDPDNFANTTPRICTNCDD